MAQILAPFSPTQTAALNQWQHGPVHPFTCGNDHPEPRDLIATPAGWICPSCDYTQNWAHDFMLTRPATPIADTDQDTGAIAGSHATHGANKLSPSVGFDPARMSMFLEILSAMGGTSNASDYAENWINAFCEDHEKRDPDTFNQAIDAGYVDWSHDSDSDHSTIRLTDKGAASVDRSGEAGETTKIGSTEGESAVAESETPESSRIADTAIDGGIVEVARVKADAPMDGAQRAIAAKLANHGFDAPIAGELERWADIQDDADAIVKCGERWKSVAEVIGCGLHGFDDGRSASFISPDGRVFEVGPKFREKIATLASLARKDGSL